jgi:hypothetical protein
MFSTYVKAVVFTVAWAFKTRARGIHALAYQMLLGRALIKYSCKSIGSPLLRLYLTTIGFEN